MKRLITFVAVALLLVGVGVASAANPKVKLETSKGTIVIELYPEKAPIAVNNFIDYVRAGHYDGTIFHRVIPGFMIQGGGFNTNMQEKPTREAIVNEAANGLSNARGTLAMARLPEPNSATAQFFVNLVNNDFLDHKDDTSRGFGYCVFGKVVQGLSVVDTIAAVKTGNVGPYQNVPLQPVVITKATLLEGEAPKATKP
jgi:cyclophilin family peptidyl-prolyl cis-trans isomerase